jgi:multiple sugar transport system permease protein
MKNKIEKRSKTIKSIVLALFGIIMLMPIIWMISSSFKYESDIFEMPFRFIPKNLNLQNYPSAIQKFPYIQWYKNTIFVTVGVVLSVLIFSSLAGYAFAKLKFKGKDIIFSLFIATMMIPVQVRVIPQYIIFKHLGVIDTQWAVIFPWMFNAFSIFLMRQFFMSIPDELIEAAKLDGANEYKTFGTVIIPLAKAQLSALLILSFTWGWNDYFGPLIYIHTPNRQVLSVGIASFKAEYADNFGIQMAGATMALLPLIVLYLFAQKNFIEGIALSGVKG